MNGGGNRNIYQAMLRSRVVGAIASARAASGITHQALKGEVLEILISDLFVPLLPADVGIGTGLIIECRNGRLSNQVDIVLYDRSVLPPLLFGRGQGVFPIEAVLYAIEVKTKLNREELQSSHNHVKTLHEFEYAVSSGAVDQVERVRSIIFALDTDLSSGGTSEIDRYKDIYGSDSPYLRALCVVDRGYWYDDGQKWLNYKLAEKFDEVLAFIGGVTNTYKGVALSRGNPNLGNYIIPTNYTGISLTATKPGDTVKVSVTSTPKPDPNVAGGAQAKDES
jgi:hypothetical protein